MGLGPNTPGIGTEKAFRGRSAPSSNRGKEPCRTTGSHGRLIQTVPRFPATPVRFVGTGPNPPRSLTTREGSPALGFSSSKLFRMILRITSPRLRPSSRAIWSIFVRNSLSILIEQCFFTSPPSVFLNGLSWDDVIVSGRDFLEN